MPFALGLVLIGGIAMSAPAYLPSLQVRTLKSHLDTATRVAVLTPSPGPPLDPAGTRALLDRDPFARAEEAVYDAALLRPDRARLFYAPQRLLQGPPSARWRESFRQVDLLFTPAASGPPALTQAAPRPRPSRSAGTRAVLTAAAVSAGVDPGFLIRTAVRESASNPVAMARTSSARGMFQFVEQSWLIAVFKWGARHGLAREARLIRVDREGRAYVRDPDAAREILALRYFPQYAAALAAESAAENARLLENALGRPPSGSELYAAHLLGSGGAIRLIQAAYSRPSLPAAWLFPQAAASNARLFYRRGAPVSVSELLGTL